MDALKAVVTTSRDEAASVETLWREPLKCIAECVDNQEKRDALATSLVPLARLTCAKKAGEEDVLASKDGEKKEETTTTTTAGEDANEPPKPDQYDFVSRDVSFSTPRGKFDVYKMKNASSLLLCSCNPKKKESLLLTKENMSTFAVLPTDDSNGTQYLVVSLKEEVKLPSVKTGIKAIVWQSRAQLSATEKKLKVSMGEGGEGAMSKERVKEAFTVGEHDLSEDDTLKNSVGLMRCYVKSCGVKEYSKGFVKVKCVLKFNDGYLFLLRKRLIFLERPAIVTLVEDLDELRIMRAEAGGSANFDLACKLNGVEHEFLNISKEYLLPVREWLSTVCEEAPAKVDEDEEDENRKEKSSKDENTARNMLQDVNSDSDDSDDSDDEDFEGEESEPEDDDGDDSDDDSDDDDQDVMRFSDNEDGVEVIEDFEFYGVPPVDKNNCTPTKRKKKKKKKELTQKKLERLAEKRNATKREIALRNELDALLKLPLGATRRSALTSRKFPTREGGTRFEKTKKEHQQTRRGSQNQTTTSALDVVLSSSSTLRRRHQTTTPLLESGPAAGARAGGATGARKIKTTTQKKTTKSSSRRY